MTYLSKDQVKSLVGLIANTQADKISCDECFGQIGEFAEYALEGTELSEGMRLIQVHLEQCPCCKDEYEALMLALRELEV